MATPSRDAVTSRKMLITGMSRGLGRALALELASRSHTIIDCSPDQTKLDSLASSFPSHLTTSISSLTRMWYVSDLQRSNNKVKEFAQVVVEKKFIPNIIGLAHKSSKMWELNVEDFDNMIDTNAKGIANILRHFIHS